MTLFKSVALALTCLTAALIANPGHSATLNISAEAPTGWVFNDATNQNAWYIGASYTLNGQSRNNVGAGVFRLQGTDTTTNAVSHFLAFCMSPLAWLRLPLEYVTGTDLEQAALNRLSALANGALGQIADSDTAGAFQLAVWEIVSEAGTLDLDAGAFVLTGASSQSARLTAQTWLDQVETGAWRSDPFGITTYKADNTQHLLTYDPPAPVPLPAGLGLLGLGLAGLLGLRGTRRA